MYYVSRDARINQYLRRIKQLIAQNTLVADFFKQLALQRQLNRLAKIHATARQIPIRPINFLDDQNLPSVVINQCFER